MTTVGEPTWYHTIDFPDGTTSPGWFDTRPAPRHVHWPGGVAGGRCLDVGTFDGFWAFTLEQRGAAEVIALDVLDPARFDWSYDNRRRGPEMIAQWRSERGQGFAVAAQRLGSKVSWIDRSVYDLDPAVDGTFDVVVCGALLLHLRDPILALERMREVCRGHLILVEAVEPRLEVRARRVPAARLNPELDQWWSLNSAGLSQALQLAGWRVVSVGPRFLVPLGPGAPATMKMPLLTGLLTRQPGRRGLLTRAFVAAPRPPADAADSRPQP